MAMPLRFFMTNMERKDNGRRGAGLAEEGIFEMCCTPPGEAQPYKNRGRRQSLRRRMFDNGPAAEHNGSNRPAIEPPFRNRLRTKWRPGGPSPIERPNAAP